MPYTFFKNLLYFMIKTPIKLTYKRLFFYFKVILTKSLGYYIISFGIPTKTVGIGRGDLMKLSTKGRYGLKAMFQLAISQSDGPIPLKQIAEKQSLSENYLEQLFSTLKKDGLLNSVRGSQGGYLLARPPEEITVGEILRSLEGELSPSDCIVEGEGDCERETICVTKNVWIKIKKSIDDVVDSITLKDMMDDNNDLIKENNKIIN